MNRLHALSGRLTLPAVPFRYVAIICGNLLLMIASSSLDSILSTTAPQPLAALTTLATVGSLACFLAAPLTCAAPARLLRLASRLRYVIVACALALSLDALLICVAGAYLLFGQPLTASYRGDAIVFTTVNTELASQGKNPYTSDAAYVSALRRFPNMFPTQLRHGNTENDMTFPSGAQMRAAKAAYLADPSQSQQEYDPRTLHNYPALSFLLYVPLRWMGVDNVLILHLLIYLALFAWLVALAPPGLRRWTALVAASAALIFGHSFLIDSEGICLAFLLLAWQYRERHWWASALLLGLGCAYKQYCWVFLPIFALDILLAHGPKETLKRGALALTAFLLPNLPYLLNNPAAWWASLWLPMTAPFFPAGIGLIALPIGHLLPFGPPALYAVLEGAAVVAALCCQLRWRGWLGDGVLLLALAPLFFAFRSSVDYFAIAPWIALYAVNRQYARNQPQPSDQSRPPRRQQRSLRGVAAAEPLRAQ